MAEEWAFLDRLLEQTQCHIGSATVRAFFRQAAGRGESAAAALSRSLPVALPLPDPREQQELQAAAQALWDDSIRELHPEEDARIAPVRESVLPAMEAYAGFCRRLAARAYVFDNLPKRGARELQAAATLVDQLLEFVHEEPSVALFDAERAAQLQEELSAVGRSMKHWIAELCRSLNEERTS